MIYLTSGCGDDDGGAGDVDAGGVVDAGGSDLGSSDAGLEDAGVEDAGMEDMGDPPEPLYAVCTLRFTPEGAVGAVALVESLDEGAIDVASALEVPGLGSCAGRTGEIFVGSSEAPVITRYAITEEGGFEETGSLSVMPLGITNLFSFDGFQIVAPNKAYYVDSTTLQVAIFDPTAMTLEGDIDLGGVDDAAGDFVFSNFGGVVRTDDRVIPFARYTDPTTERTAALTTLAFIDTDSDAVVFDSTERCGGVASGDVLANGDAYFGSNNITAANHRLGLEGAFAPCLVRALAGADAIDDTYLFELNGLTGGLPTGGLVTGPGDSAFVLAYDETVTPIGEETQPREIQAAQAWRLWSIPELGTSETATRVDSFGLTSGANFALDVEGVTYFSRIAADFSGGELVRVNADGTVVDALDTGVITLGAYRVR
ncbi:MAG: hypothetical protein AAGH15_01840 [Myxococcota bacterium]